MLQVFSPLWKLTLNLQICFSFLILIEVKKLVKGHAGVGENFQRTGDKMQWQKKKKKTLKGNNGIGRVELGWGWEGRVEERIWREIT